MWHLRLLLFYFSLAPFVSVLGISDFVYVRSFNKMAACISLMQRPGAFLLFKKKHGVFNFFKVKPSCWSLHCRYAKLKETTRGSIGGQVQQQQSAIVGGRLAGDIYEGTRVAGDQQQGAIELAKLPSLHHPRRSFGDV